MRENKKLFNNNTNVNIDNIDSDNNNNNEKDYTIDWNFQHRFNTIIITIRKRDYSTATVVAIYVSLKRHHWYLK